MDAALNYELKAQGSYEQGKPIIIEFRIENQSLKEVWILKWYTPLEGIKGKIFDVTCDGKEIPYEGRMMKRGNPVKDDYLHLSSGESAGAQVDLAQAYSLSKCNECVVKFKGRIPDVVFEEQQVPRPADEHAAVEVVGKAVSFQIVG